MNEPMRSELFAVLAELSRHYPHWRMGQLVANVAGWADAEPWDAEGEQLLAAAREHLAVLGQRTAIRSLSNDLPAFAAVEPSVNR